MRIWLVTIGEPLPSDGNGDRLLRTGILAEILAHRGHEVVWWNSSFDHARKRQRVDRDDVIRVSQNYSIHLIHSQPYPKNVCLRRWISHRATANRFAKLAAGEARPDVILASLPIAELCRAAIKYARPRQVPVIVDIRDLWPDIFVDLAPPILQRAVRLALWPLFRELRSVGARAHSIVGTTQEYIDVVLRQIGRKASDLDQPFSLGYRRTQYPAAAIQSGDLFWNQLGITRSTKDLVCCYFGTMGRHCTLETVLRAARALEERGCRARFVLCGVGDKLSQYREMARNCSSVHFPGWVDGAKIQTLMERSSVGLAPYLCNTNYLNNIPNKPIEYLSAGLPIVSSLQGVLERLIAEHQCGGTYRNDDVEQLTDLLLRLASDPAKRQQLSANAANLYESQFDADVVYRKMACYLEGVANDSRRLTERVQQSRTPHFILRQNSSSHLQAS